MNGEQPNPHPTKGENPSDTALHVMPGVEGAPSVNPYILKQRELTKKSKFSPEEIAKGVLDGNRTLLSKAITLVESNREDHSELAQMVLEKILPRTGNSIRVGITGVPGVGKSTFIESFGLYLLEKGKRVAVLAIDPTSQKTHGSILGDKTRMENLSRAEGCFIRPSPSSGSLGGVARKTRESMYLCEAAGFDVIIIETVGVGQSETQVHSMVDFFLLLMLAGAGDELQGIKRGIMEMADLIAINKADGKNEPYAIRAKAEYESALYLFPPPKSKWFPRAITCSGLDGKGTDEIWKLILDYSETTKTNGHFEQNRKDQSRLWFRETLKEAVIDKFYGEKGMEKTIQMAEENVVSGKSSLLKEIKKLVAG
ncbi:methylmalonyl Co-A mutase-associated GTPase MeaB [Leptospira ilyithenensis]|uniref:Methylmalonyl Co-A mutase-associated GTPase MeaB n=2 Tax=Leptospira ilyithenensis TaxID=2484901 RepID=A0A4R9LSN4_9LEPT|nr:methylmalonyl Co-A mutase-associated GTPase MeaB [Leptospira ilyithenensis]